MGAISASLRFAEVEAITSLDGMRERTKEFVLEWHKLKDINNWVIKAKFGKVSHDSEELGVVDDCARRIAEGVLSIDDALKEIDRKDLSITRQFEVERFQRAVDGTVSLSQLREFAKQIFQASYAQRAGINWILRQGPDSWVVSSDS